MCLQVLLLFGKKKEVGLLPTIAHTLLEETGDHAPLDRYTLKILDKWEAKENVDADEQQYLRLSMSRIIDTMNKRNPILQLIGEAKLNEYRQKLKKEDLNLPSTISDFINSFNKQVKDENEKDLMLFIMQAKLGAWTRNNEDLKKVIEIYEYLVVNLAELKNINKTYSELQCFFPAYHILSILFRDTNIKIVIGEKGCDTSKNARKINEQCFTLKKPTNVRGRKLDLMLVYDDIVLCSAEWKSMASSRAVIMKQFIKNLRVNNCILHELREHLDDDNTIILGMDWKGLLGYSYCMKMIDKAVVVKETCKLFLPQDKCEFEDFFDTVASLVQFKAHYVDMTKKLKVKISKHRRDRFYDEQFNITPTNSRSPSPHTFFTPKRPTTARQHEE
ncbi:hypothetical protein BCV72DRAFT_88081 [Rhizopus microsporus var. microsporus]|uniref:Uncharacterized protein n=1 Tax=Rhizopus microsporus var. microsporus TaxID=86635 RepID=A0A1X0QMP0_RHIZD|nr:hypothetical protein BCV72DRAFT_88081 [Rhizopus microsporus var. microsporus]